MAPLLYPPPPTGDLLQPLELAALPGAHLLLDLRSARRHRRGHIPGSHHLPAARLLSGEPPDGDLVLIGEDTAHSARVIESLHAQGYHRRLRHLDGGHAAWEARGLPVEAEPATGPTRVPDLPGLVAGGLLLGAAALSQSLPLLGLGLVLLCSPWVQSRSRAGA